MSVKKYSFDLQGHRGARGLVAENTLKGFQKAIDLDVNTIELDVVISKDSMVVVSHEAYMNPIICLDANGDSLTNKTDFNLYQMTYDEIKSFDCGSLKHSEFPNQKNFKAYKPLLSDVIQLTTQNLRDRGRRVSVNIELKSLPETDDIYHPKPEVFVDLVMNTIRGELIPLTKITLQSFDERIVRYILEEYPGISVAYLVEEGDFFTNLKTLNAVPTIYSPQYKALDSLDVKRAHDAKVKVIPWTVNKVEDMQRLLEYGVDGLITDYPNLAKVFHQK
jgi:glycerophosphoryl diester phosphodiesterase